MVYLNEWFPNPAGADAAGEFVELYNSGSAAFSLDGYALGTGAKKRVSLSGRTIPPGGYLVLKKAETGLTLKNTDGAVFLYGPGGKTVDQAAFQGSAPEGKSFSRMDYGASAITGHFAFADPTSGVRNKEASAMVASVRYPEGVSLVPQASLSSLILLSFGTSLVMLSLFAYIFSKNEDLSHCLFGGDATAR